MAFVDDKSRNIFNWIEWVVEGMINIIASFLSFKMCKFKVVFLLTDNLTLNFVEKANTRKNVRLKAISTKTLKKYMQALTKALEVKIAGLLPDRFGQVFDGWSNGGVHYIATFAAFHGQPEDKPILLAFSPVDDEQDLTAMSHYDFLVDTNDYYGKSLDNLVFIVSNNCSTNQAIARRTTLFSSTWNRPFRENSRANEEIIYHQRSCIFAHIYTLRTSTTPRYTME